MSTIRFISVPAFLFATLLALSACSSTGPQAEEHPVIHETSPADLRAVHSNTPIASAGATLYVNGLGCPLCASNIDRQLVRVPGVKKVTVDLSEGKVALDFKDSPRPSPHQLESAVADAGFTLVKLEITGESK